jgi:anthranilate phosphoribosyltransferase
MNLGFSLLQQGNRSSSSACGSADVLEALGVVIDLGPQVNANPSFTGPLC